MINYDHWEPQEPGTLMEYEKYKAWIKSARARVAYAPTVHFLSLLKCYDNLMGLEPITHDNVHVL